ncbi:hypothetical protein MNBD_GAMMA12-560 [hydrothermal vent metagenome]|uniref:SrpA-related protein n=1 Tax=hydrothermal vent metagenome TaxID=652676 RepID=A0A3B0XXW4_9ZZZZ
MNISSASSYAFQAGVNTSEKSSQRKVEALVPPGADTATEFKNIDLKNTSGNITGEAEVKEDSKPEQANRKQDEGEQYGNETKNKESLSPEEREQIASLSKREREVQAHESAHLAAAGSLAKSGAKFEYTKGPDGRRYATGGEVSIDSSQAQTPEATLIKAQRIRAAALAPATPSAQDQRVSAKASQLMFAARSESQQQKIEEREQKVSKQEEVKESGLIKSSGNEKVLSEDEQSESGKIRANKAAGQENVSVQAQSSDKLPIISANKRASEYSDIDNKSGAGRIFNLVT